MARIEVDPVTRCPRCREESASDKDPCWRCQADPYPEDTELRANGFRIVSRPARLSALWRSPPTKQHRQGRVIPHAKALALIRKPAPVPDQP